MIDLYSESAMSPGRERSRHSDNDTLTVLHGYRSLEQE